MLDLVFVVAHHMQLVRLFGIEIEGCARCGGKLTIIASIEEPQVIAKILWHLQRKAPEQYQTELPLGDGRRRCKPACWSFMRKQARWLNAKAVLATAVPLRGAIAMVCYEAKHLLNGPPSRTCSSA